MNTKKSLLFVALIAVLTLSAAPGRVLAQNQEPGFGTRMEGWHGERGRHHGFRSGRGMLQPGHHGLPGLHRALERLDLTDSQRAEIREIFEAERSQVEANHEGARELGAELREQIETDPYNEEAVRAKAAGVAALQVEMAVLRARQSGQIRELLTPEQLEEMERMRERRQSFRGERRERFEQRRWSKPGS